MFATRNKPDAWRNKSCRCAGWRDRYPRLRVLTSLLAFASVVGLLVCWVSPGSTVLAHEAVYPLQQTVQPTLPPRPMLEPTMPPRPTPGSTLAPRPTLVPTVIQRPTLAPKPTDAPRPASPHEPEPTPVPTPAVLPVSGGARNDFAACQASGSAIWWIGLISGCGALIGASLVLRRKAR